MKQSPSANKGKHNKSSAFIWLHKIIRTINTVYTCVPLGFEITMHSTLWQMNFFRMIFDVLNFIWFYSISPAPIYTVHIVSFAQSQVEYFGFETRHLSHFNRNRCDWIIFEYASSVFAFEFTKANEKWAIATNYTFNFYMYVDCRRW